MAIPSNHENMFKGTSKQLFAVVAGTLAAISDGMQYGWTSPVIPLLLAPDSPLPITKKEAEWLKNLLLIGSFVGLYSTIFFVDKIGRKRSMLLSSFVTLLVWIVTAIAPRVEYIYVARAFAGSAGNMAFVAAPMYVAEIADKKIRGFLSSLIYIMMLIGIVTIYSVAPFVPFYAHCIIGAALVVLQLIIFPFMPESPYYLLYKDRPLEARKSLKWLRVKGADIDKELEEIKCAVERQKTEKGRLQDLFMVPSNRKGILIMAVLNAAQHFSSISVILMNLHLILEAAGSVYIDSKMAGILFAVIMIFAACAFSLVIDKYGRKTLLTVSSLLTGSCLLTIAVYFNLKNIGYDLASVSWIPIVAVMCYACSFKLGLGMVPIVLLSELFPAKMKAMGMTLADGCYVAFGILSLQVYYFLSESCGLQYPFYVFAISCFSTAFFAIFFIPETKGKTLEEIQYLLKGESPPVKNDKVEIEYKFSL